MKVRRTENKNVMIAYLWDHSLNKWEFQYSGSGMMKVEQEVIKMIKKLREDYSDDSANIIQELLDQGRVVAAWEYAKEFQCGECVFRTGGQE